MCSHSNWCVALTLLRRDKKNIRHKMIPGCICVWVGVEVCFYIQIELDNDCDKPCTWVYQFSDRDNGITQHITYIVNNMSNRLTLPIVPVNCCIGGGGVYSRKDFIDVVCCLWCWMGRACRSRQGREMSLVYRFDSPITQDSLAGLGAPLGKVDALWTYFGGKKKEKNLVK